MTRREWAREKAECERPYSRCSVCGHFFYRHTGDSGVGCPYPSNEKELERQRTTFLARMRRLTGAGR